MNQKVDISITIPVFNSAGGLLELDERLHKVLNSLHLNYEIIYIDDASSDSSWEVLLKLKEGNPDKLKVISLERNYGQHQALVCGFNFSSGDLVLTMDDDLQHPPEEIAKLLEAQKEYKCAVTYGVYRTNQHGMLKSTSSFVLQKSAKYFSEHGESVGSSFRLFTKDIILKICEKPQNFVFIDEIIHWYTGDIRTVEVEHHPRKHGKSTYTWSKRRRLYMDIVVNYTAWPLKLMVRLGSFASIFSFLAGIFFIIRKMFFNVRVEGFTFTIVAILFSSSLILLSLGIIGKYLFKIYQNQSGKPPYSVKKIR